MTDPELLTVSQAAEACKATSQTIRNWIRSDQLHAVRIGNRFLVPRSEVERLHGGRRKDSAESPWDYGSDAPPERLKRRTREHQGADHSEGFLGG